MLRDRVYLSLAAAALILAATTQVVSSGAPFARHFGRLPPLAVFVGVSLAGGFGLSALAAHGFRLHAAKPADARSAELPRPTTRLRGDTSVSQGRTWIFTPLVKPSP